MNKALLKSAAYKNGFTFCTLSKKLGTTPQMFSRKANGSSRFFVNDVIKIKKVLSLTQDEVFDIFFNE